MNNQALNLGQEVHTKGAAIAGVVSCVPANMISNEGFIAKFGAQDVNNVVKILGVQSRRWVDDKTTTTDLCEAAIKKLMGGLGWQEGSVDALIFLSQTPDFRLPPSACVLHGRLNFPPSCVAFDVNLGCSGYPYALWLGMTMVQSGAARRVILAVGDAISRVLSPEDRSTIMLFGDAATATAIEASDLEDATAHFILGTEGKGAYNLIVPRGGLRDYSLSGDERLASKDPSCMFMDGDEIFNFVIRKIPPLIKKISEFPASKPGDFDAFLMHQANKFIVEHLIRKAGLPRDRVPINIDRFGNVNSASIPLLMTTELKNQLLTERLRLAMFGFGVGYSWAAAALSAGPMKIVETIEI